MDASELEIHAQERREKYCARNLLSLKSNLAEPELALEEFQLSIKFLDLVNIQFVLINLFQRKLC